VANIALFHSVYGLRPAVLADAERLREAGHTVITPDLFGGRIADTVDEGFAISKEIGTATVMERARAAVADLPPSALLAGYSYGCGVAGDLLAERPDAAGLLLVSGPGGEPGSVRPGLPIQVHVADPDEYDSPADMAAWRDAMVEAGAEVAMFGYPGVGHLFTDPDLPDYDRTAAELTWERSVRFLSGL